MSLRAPYRTVRRLHLAGIHPVEVTFNDFVAFFLLAVVHGFRMLRGFLDDLFCPACGQR